MLSKIRVVYDTKMNTLETNLSKKLWQERYLSPLTSSLVNSTNLKTVIFLRGISGSGKTTVSDILSEMLGSEKVVSFSADSYFTIDGIYKFDIKKISDAHRHCVRSMEIALQSDAIRYIIMDNTHTQLWHLYNAEEIANQYDTNLYYIDINVPDKAHFLLCLQRQRHNVPEEVLLYQWNNWEENTKSRIIPMYVSDEEMNTITDAL